MADGSNRSARWLLAVVTFLIVYGSLFPFNFGGLDVHGPRELLSRLTFARTTRADIAINLLLYLPLGACLAWILTSRLGGALAVAVATAAGASLSLTIEILQLFETRRVASLADVALNATGACAGALLAATLLASRDRLGLPGLGALVRSPAPTALALLWIGSRLAPFAPSLDPDKWHRALTPLQGGLDLSRAWIRWAVPYLVLAEALRAATRRDSGVWPLALVACVVFTGRILVVGKEVVPAEVAGMLAALVLAWINGFLDEKMIATLLSVAIAALLVSEQLVPFAPDLSRWEFGWVPFAGSLGRLFGVGLIALFRDCFLYGALVWLLCRSGIAVGGATLLAAGFVFGLELLQAVLPGRSGDITDPLLTLATGALLALFDPAMGAESGRAGSRGAWSAARGRRSR
ncbi:MAG: VanZ family protein [Steroidobacteraceae bacterium]